MINNKNITVGFLLLLSSSFTLSSRTQGWDCISSSCNVKKQPWSINVNTGATSYFGDLSIYDINPIKKIQLESGLAFGIIGTRYFNNTYGLSLQMLSGKMCANKDDVSFQSNFIEYNLQGRVNLLRLFNKYYDTKLNFEVYAGAGQFLYQTTKSVGTGPDSNPSLHKVRVPEFVYFFGSGLSYPIASCISLTADLALRQCQTDRLDDFVNGADYDYYTYLSFGVSFYIGSIKKSGSKKHFPG